MHEASGVFLKAGALCLVLMVCVASGARAEERRSILDGVYTQAQSDRGIEAYMQHCSRCHRDDLTGNPEAMPLTGNRFVNNWREDSLASLLTYMSTRMPRGESKLAPSMYADILGFILKTNGYPPGVRELTAETAAQAQFVGKDGPRPLPNSALVLVVGCLTNGGSDAWTLAAATDPVRNRTAKETTPEELQASAALRPGTRVFRLQNFEYVRDGFSPVPYKGQRVQVKGALIQQTNNDRINVTSLETVSSSCS